MFSRLFLDYINGENGLAPFVGAKPNIEAFRSLIEEKTSKYIHREPLVHALKRQMGGEASLEQKENLDKLALSNCFTITTGHQLNIVTGPLYFIYKIITTIKLAQELARKYPSYTFVPVFWMASEDHDFEEINHFHLFGKQYVWQREARGAVGRLSTSGMGELLNSVPDLPVWIRDAYTESNNLVEATRKIVNQLFASHGLLILDGDDSELKGLIRPLMKADLLESTLAPVVRATSEKLEEEGYKAQAFVRDQNFFYLKDAIRQRIEKRGERFVIVNTDVEFDEAELSNEIEKHPERFSPNVLLRPLYQETILPNLAYVGGPGEIAYWLQLKDLFVSQHELMPILFPRNFVTILSSAVLQRIEEADLHMEDLFMEEVHFQEILLEKLNVEQFDFEGENRLLNDLRASLLDKANKADKTLIQAAEAEMARINKSLSDFHKRLDKALENRHQSDINKFQNIRKRLFPAGELQERHDNFLNFYINHPDMINRLCEELDPFVFAMNCLVLK